MARITVPLFADPRENPHLVELGIRNLVLRLHGVASCRCLASCQGHGWFRDIKREPYIYFHSRPEIAEWIAAIVEVLPLSRRWNIQGIMHPDLGLCFSLQPGEQSPFVGGHSADWQDLELLTRVLPEAVQFPQQEHTTYRDRQEAAKKRVPALVEQIGTQ